MLRWAGEIYWCLRLILVEGIEEGGRGWLTIMAATASGALVEVMEDDPDI